MAVSCGSRHAVHPPGEHHETVAQALLCHRRPFGLLSVEDEARVEWHEAREVEAREHQEAGT